VNAQAQEEGQAAFNFVVDGPHGSCITGRQSLVAVGATVRARSKLVSSVGRLGKEPGGEGQRSDTAEAGTEGATPLQDWFALAFGWSVLPSPRDVDINAETVRS
jgi:hypothetical protein